MNTANDESYVAGALADARAHLRMLGRSSSGPDIIFDVLVKMFDIEHRWKLPDGPASEGSAWPEYIHDPDEKAEAARQRMLEGEQVNKRLPSSRELSTMEAVNRLFRSHLVGEKQDRDWAILRLLADPKPVMRGKKDREKQVRRPRTVREVGTRFGISGARVSERKILQCSEIWKKVEHLMPLSRTETSRILRSVDLDQDVMVAA